MTFREIVKALCSGNSIAFDMEELHRKIHMEEGGN